MPIRWSLERNKNKVRVGKVQRSNTVVQRTKAKTHQ